MSLNRRTFLKESLVAGLGLGWASLATRAEGASSWLDRERPSTGDPRAADFHFVHLTDQHVYDKRQGNEGYQACIASIIALREKPEFVVMGGDMVFDGGYNTKADYLRWLGQLKRISDRLPCPWYPCMGNHDPFGLHPRRKCDADDPDIGKQLIQQALDWPETYYSFDHQGWHFAVLDCIFPVVTERGPSYVAKIGPEQLEWLAYDLGAAGQRPKVVVTHIAALYLAAQADGNQQAKAMVPGMVLEDNKDLRLVLERHQVKALLQGHCHHIEEFRYKGVRYLTSAAGSAAWWAGDWVGSPPGYTLFRCEGEELSWEHKTFPWKPVLEPNDTLERERQAAYDAELEEQQRLLQLERAGLKPVGATR